MNSTVSTADPRAALATALAGEEEKLLACVHCGFCLQACPTYTRLGDEADSPRGRLHLMRAVADGRLDPESEAFGLHIDRCLGCRACETVCPSGVEYGHLLERARDVIARRAGVSPASRALLRVFGSRALSRAALAAGRLVRASGVLPHLVRYLPRRFGRIRFGLAMLAATSPRPPFPTHAAAATRHRAAPGPVHGDAGAGRTTAPGHPDAGSPGAAHPVTGGAVSGVVTRSPCRGEEGNGGTRVALLTGCVQEGLFARVNRATEQVLEANGCTLVPAPRQQCCGALHAHGGSLDGARALARANVDAFEAVDVDHVVVNAAGCGAAMKEYGALLADDPAYAERARVLASRVRDLSELLVELGPRAGAPLPLRVTYDAPCHLHHAQRITRAPLDVLAAIPGLSLIPLPDADECCGGAGIYGVLHPDLGGRILSDKVAAVRSTGADVVVTPNPGCMMQIGAGLLLAASRTAVLHPVEILAESYRRLDRDPKIQERNTT